ncbi:MAG: hypothetical protein LBN21_11545, partial [Treponema sp.]|nr:hypothetical protein [Treponema sp.]
MSTRIRLILTFSICLSLAYGSIAIIIFSSNRKTAGDRFNALALSQLERVEERIQTFLEPGELSAKYLAELDLVRASRGRLTSYLDTAEQTTLWYANHSPYEQRIYDEFIRVYNSNANFDLVFMANDDGQYAQAPEGRYKNPGYDPRLRPWYLEAIQSENEITVSSPYFASSGDKLIMSIVVKTYDLEGTPLGFLGIDYNLEKLMNDLSTRRIMNTGYFGTVDRNGRVLTNGLYPELVTAHPEDRPPMFDRIVDGPDGVFIGPGVGGFRRHIVSHSISDIGWKLLVIFDEREVLASSYGLLRTILTTSGIVFLLALVIMSVLSRSIVHPLEELIEASGLISSGEYETQESVRESLMKKLKVTGSGESRKLANALRSMLTTMEDRIDAAQAANAAKGEFLSKMSHEMRTPLNAIIGLSELELGSEELPENSHNNVEKIYVSGMTLLGIINDILDISKIDSGNFTLVPAEYELPSLISDTAIQNMVRIGSRPIEFKLHIEETLPFRLIGDELRVKQIFNNLLSNAFKYTQEGSVDWYISGETDGDSVWLSCRIQDTGIGIRKKDIAKLFTEYNQVSVKSSNRVDGTGLGLSITKNLVERMDGAINVESEYGKGSAFSFRIRQKYVNDQVIGSDVLKNLSEFHYTADRRSRKRDLV